eukprot:TRINITY_DN11699_c0_g1_i1.p1 TRINITY_DN11699_c0_g1~~TRINITY_DN11699_c0_g1_i1.p1  ORF type:complete len:587 (+),score=143.95 TRINITY_DN11699_c0_g1_i1:95-1855(+)
MRLDAVAELVKDDRLRISLCDALLALQVDIERLAARLALQPAQQCANRTPAKRQAEAAVKNLVMLKHVLDGTGTICTALAATQNPLLCAAAENARAAPLARLRGQLLSTFSESAGYTRARLQLQTQLCFAIKPNVNALLDVARKTYTETIEDIHGLVKDLCQRFSLPFRVRHAVKRGYYLELSKRGRGGDAATDSATVGDPFEKLMSPPFISVHRTGAKATCTTAELDSLSRRNESAYDEAILITERLVAELACVVQKDLGHVYKLAESAALLDLLLSFSLYAKERDCVRPEIHADGVVSVAVKQGRHPVLDVLQRGAFVPNDTFIGDTAPFQLVTGPNMSGKSTYVRQVALVTVLAHIGCFVPAQFAAFRVVDRLLARIGADELVGEARSSTFTVEMREIALVLRQAEISPHCLVVIDELGRGTSNVEGEAIAWSVGERLLQCRGARVLFVTHYRRIAQRLPALYPRAAAYYFGVERSAGSALRPLFVLTQGAAPAACRACALEMAELAGMPPDVTRRAAQVRRRLAADDEGNDTNTQLVDEVTQKARVAAALATKLLNLHHSSLDTDSLRRYLATLKAQYSAEQ